MFYIDINHNGEEKRHTFHNEKYARGFMKAMYHEKLWHFEKEPERYEIQGRALTESEFRISVKDKSRLYFLGRAADVKSVFCSGRIGRQVKAGLR